MLYCHIAMKTLEEVAALVPFSKDQTRRRLKRLMDAGLIERERDPHARNKWLYEEKTVALLNRLGKLEEMFPPQDALFQLLAEEKGETPRIYRMTEDQLRALAEEQERTIARLREENARLQKKIQQLSELRKGRPPVEAGLLKRLKAAVRLILGQ